MGEETRRISADPLAVHAPGEAALNPYAYVHGKVLVAVDPVGLCDSDTQSCTEQYTYTTETGEAGDYHNEVRDVPDVKADTVDQGSGEPRTDVVILDQGFKRRVIPKADYQALQLQGRFSEDVQARWREAEPDYGQSTSEIQLVGQLRLRSASSGKPNTLASSSPLLTTPAMVPEVLDSAPKPREASPPVRPTFLNRADKDTGSIAGTLVRSGAYSGTTWTPIPICTTSATMSLAIQ